MRPLRALPLALTLLACASSTHVDLSPAEVPFTPPSTGAEAAPPAAAPDPDDGPPVAFTRSTMRQTVHEGIGALLARVDVSPMLQAGRFVGFRLDRARGLQRLRAGGLDLQPGDIVTRVNGQTIERPEHAQAAFLSLAEAPEIVIDVLRRGAPVTVRTAVTDSATAAPATTTAAR